MGRQSVSVNIHFNDEERGLGVLIFSHCALIETRILGVIADSESINFICQIEINKDFENLRSALFAHEVHFTGGSWIRIIGEGYQIEAGDKQQ